jgi:hypothetical protein
MFTDGKRAVREYRLRSGTVAWPRPMEQETPPHQADEEQQGAKQVEPHGSAPSRRWGNGAIFLDVQAAACSAGFRDTTLWRGSTTRLRVYSRGGEPLARHAE